jgi:hypothetical protein
VLLYHRPHTRIGRDLARATRRRWALLVGNLSLSWTHPLTGMTITDVVDLAAPSTPDAPPAAGYFTADTVEKGFVMLNLYAGFQLASQLAADSDPRTARRTLETLRPNVQAWVSDHPDPDITDDLKYVDLFVTNLMAVEDQVIPYTQRNGPPDRSGIDSLSVDEYLRPGSSQNAQPIALGEAQQRQPRAHHLLGHRVVRQAVLQHVVEPAEVGLPRRSVAGTLRFPCRRSTLAPSMR